MNYAALQATAGRLLAGSGGPLTFTRSSAGAYNPATGTAAVVLTDFVVTGTVIDYPDINAPGTDILSGDKRILISAVALSAVPQPGDYLTIGGVRHSIINIKRLAPSGLPVLYTAQARRGA